VVVVVKKIGSGYLFGLCRIRAKLVLTQRFSISSEAHFSSKHPTDMKIAIGFLSCALLGSTVAFTPISVKSRAFALRPVYSEPEEKAGALVPIKEETVQFTAGILGGAIGLAVGGPVLGAIGAAAANYASKNDLEIGEVVQAVSKSSIEVYNYLAKLDAKYELLNKTKASLQQTYDKLKATESVDPETLKKVEDAIAGTTAKISEINEEYDLVGAGVTALGVVGDVIDKAIKKVGELNEEYKLTDKALDAVKKAIESAKATSSA
jgi:prefoldin subunit 5